MFLVTIDRKTLNKSLECGVSNEYPGRFKVLQ